jgi:hypothetical protein
LRILAFPLFQRQHIDTYSNFQNAAIAPIYLNRDMKKTASQLKEPIASDARRR